MVSTLNKTSSLGDIDHENDEYSNQGLEMYQPWATISVLPSLMMELEELHA